MILDAFLAVMIVVLAGVMIGLAVRGLSETED